MSRTPNIFYNLVTDENSTTELLCNLMRFDAFRRPLLTRLLPVACACDISWEDIDTQIDLRQCGRPDVVVENDQVLVLVEVKVTPDQGLTENQPDSYFNYLISRNDKLERLLIFLVPKVWKYLQFVQDSLVRLKSSHPTDNIQARVVFWEEVITLIEENDLGAASPLVDEFCSLLSGRYETQPVILSANEVVMLFSNGIPTALSSLERLITGIQERSSIYNSEPSRSRGICPQEHGLYFKDAQGNKVLWFGVWMPFWKEHSKPLCFGVADTWQSAIRETFRTSYTGPTKHFKGYTLGWIDKDLLARGNAVEDVWKILDPIVKASGEAPEASAVVA